MAKKYYSGYLQLFWSKSTPVLSKFAKTKSFMAVLFGRREPAVKKRANP